MKSEKTNSQTRGIRNNNPMNIRVGNHWLGEVKNPTDKEFEQFTDMKYGLRAAILILWRYIKVYHLDNIYDIIKRWAPPTENNTGMYFHTVTRMIEPHAWNMRFGYIDWTKYHVGVLIWAMCRIESGYELNDDVFNEAWELAAKTNPKIVSDIPEHLR